MTLFYCGSLTSVRSPMPAYPYRLSGFTVHVAALLFSWSRPQPTCSEEPIHSGSLRRSLRPVNLRSSLQFTLEEATPFRTEASSNGALPSLSQQYSFSLSDVGRKTKGIQTAHTLRAKLHQHGFSRGLIFSPSSSQSIAAPSSTPSSTCEQAQV